SGGRAVGGRGQRGRGGVRGGAAGDGTTGSAGAGCAALQAGARGGRAPDLAGQGSTVRRGVAAVLVLAACTHEPELASGHIVVRDAQGALTCQLSATSYGFYRKPSGPRIRVSGGRADAGEGRIRGPRPPHAGRRRAAHRP